MTRRHLIVLFAFSLSLAGCSCGNSDPQNLGDGGTHQNDGGTDGGDDGGTDGGQSHLTGLTVAPQDALLDINGSTPASQVYTVTAQYDDGHTQDVSAEASFSLGDPTLGQFSGHTFVSTISKGGTTQITASFQGQFTGTGITLVDHQIFTPGTGFPSDPSQPFTGPADAAKNPSLVYPNDGVLLPPNLGRLEFHFVPKSAGDLFRLSFQNAYTDVKVYLSCDTQLNGGCIYAPAPAVWSAIANGNRGKGGLNVLLEEADAAGTGVGTSNALTISFSRDDLHGGLYYWTTSTFSDGVSTAIMRYDFAGVQTAASRFLTAKDTNPPDGGSSGVSCMGCHALSPDGTKVVAEVQGQNDGRILMYDVSNSTPLVDFPADNGSSKSIFESWNPDGTQFVGVDMDNGNYPLRIHDGLTGQLLYSIAGTGDSTHAADHPDWSHDGNKIVYMRAGTNGTCQRSYNGALEMVSRLADGGWSAPQTVLDRVAGKNRYYPAFAPDDSFIVYDESTCLNTTNDKSCNADTDPTATVYAMALDGGTPIALTNANKPGPLDVLADGGVQTMLTDSFPKWSPFVNQRTGNAADKVMWLTFASSRNFGLRTPVAGSGEAQLGRGTLLWMVAIDPAKVAAGQDPSYPAFALPFQDLDTSNHIAQWTQTLVDGVCPALGNVCDPQINNCCSGLICQSDNGDPPISTCQPPPQVCGAQGDSCDPGNNTCCDNLACQPGAGDPPQYTCRPYIN